MSVLCFLTLIQRHKQNSDSATCYVVDVIQEKSDYIVVNLLFNDLNSILE